MTRQQNTPQYPATFPGPHVSIDLARLLAPPPRGAPTPWLAGYLLTWDAVTGANTVGVGALTYANLNYIDPAGLAVGPVILINLPDASPIILGRIYRPTT